MAERKAIVIHGASGDLAKRKLVPALNALNQNKRLDPDTIIVGSGRTFFSDQAFRNRFNAPEGFRELLYYHQGIQGLKQFIEEKGAFSRIVFFCALPPSTYGQTAQELRAEGFGKEAALIIEKPFGYDRASAQVLNTELTKYFNETQIFRIDHYLAKEAVQNILVFRFANPVFTPVWNSECIESIQINAFESEGVADRGAYFDSAGIVRDMIQNHLIQLLCLLTMDVPVSLNAEEIQKKKISVLKTMQVLSCNRFQYQGYHDEKGVAPGSTTETFAELKLVINNPRWKGVPVYIRAGKAMNRKGTEIGIRLKPLPNLLFNEKGAVQPNKIVFLIQPMPGIVLDVATKIPGKHYQIAQTPMKFCYRDSFDSNIPEAYQKLLEDALNNDRTLFVSAKEAEASWELFGPVLDAGKVEGYEKFALPFTRFSFDWIDFERYPGACSK